MLQRHLKTVCSGTSLCRDWLSRKAQINTSCRCFKVKATTQSLWWRPLLWLIEYVHLFLRVLQDFYSQLECCGMPNTPTSMAFLIVHSLKHVMFSFNFLHYVTVPLLIPAVGEHRLLNSFAWQWYNPFLMESTQMISFVQHQWFTATEEILTTSAFPRAWASDLRDTRVNQKQPYNETYIKAFLIYTTI